MLKFVMLAAPALLSLAALSGTAQAAAAPAADEVRVVVPYGDLNLASADGMGALRHRVEAAARKICGPEPTDHLAFGAIYDGCVRSTAHRALAGFDPHTDVMARNETAAPFNGGVSSSR